MHVVQPPGVRREGADRRGLLPVNALLALAIGIVAAVVHLIRADRLAEVERRRRPCPARVFPLGLRGQAKSLARLLTQLLAEFLAVAPGHRLHGQSFALECAGVAARHRRPLGLCHLMDAQMESLAEPRMMLRLVGTWIPFAILLADRTAHEE